MPSLKAKSGEDREETTLVGHTRCVLGAVNALFTIEGEEPSQLARSWLRFFGLDTFPQAFARFMKHLRVAAAAHDWGKANDGFQGVVSHSPGITQVVRHELLSALILSDVAMISWLRDDAELDEVVVLAAVVGHHLKASGESIGLPIPADGVVRLFRDHEDFGAIRAMVASEAGTDNLPPITMPRRMKKDEVNQRGSSLKALLDAGMTDDRARMVRAVRSALIVADSVGSAVVRVPDALASDPSERTASWLRGCFSKVLTGDEVWANVTQRRIADLIDKKRWNKSEGHSFNGQGGFTKFQCDVASLGPRALLTAACGSGKTLAAWNWIKVQLDKQGPRSRVLFLYPTRATATEGFRDYVSWAPEDDAGLLSGTAAYELKDMFESPEKGDDPRSSRDYRANARLFALGHWGKRVFSATADQFFPFLTFNYGPTCMLPLLAEAVVVVDEVHSFDRSMFATLKRFLREFPSVPVLCMTATLPEGREYDLTDLATLGDGVLKRYEEKPDDLKRLSETDRYIVEWIDRTDALNMTREALVAKQRVLWVSNRVVDCQVAFEEIENDDDLDIDTGARHCYHSRFTLDHRKKHHKNLVGSFQASARAAESYAVFGSTTQVCEMSLDLDAHVLITALAPIASLIQRMGRCNRDASKLDRERPGRVYVLRPEPGKEKPYEKVELEAARRFVDLIQGQPISQDDLEKAYRKCDASPVESSKLCPFLDNGPYARADEPWRDTDEFTVPCILQQDERKVLEALHDRDPAMRIIDGSILPVPVWVRKEKSPSDPKFPRWLSVVSGLDCYDASIGFDERKAVRGGRD